MCSKWSVNSSTSNRRLESNLPYRRWLIKTTLIPYKLAWLALLAKLASIHRSCSIEQCNPSPLPFWACLGDGLCLCIYLFANKLLSLTFFFLSHLISHLPLLSPSFSLPPSRALSNLSLSLSSLVFHRSPSFFLGDSLNE